MAPATTTLVSFGAIAARAREAYHARMTRRRIPVSGENLLDEGAARLTRLHPTIGFGFGYLEEHEEAPPEDASFAHRFRRARLGSPIPFGMTAAPLVVEVEGSQLVWRRLGGRMFPDSAGLLGRFVALHDAPAEQIAAFARLYGVLGICKDGRPWPHVRETGTGHLIVCPWVRHGDDGGEEPLAAWRALARTARTLLEDMASRRDLSTLHLATVEDRWLKPAHVRLGVEGGDPCFSALATDGLSFGLFAALGVQLLVVGLGAYAVRKCDGCQALFFEVREVPRRTERRIFCEGCRGRRARAAASRDYRARRKR